MLVTSAEVIHPGTEIVRDRQTVKVLWQFPPKRLAKLPHREYFRELTVAGNQVFGLICARHVSVDLLLDTLRKFGRLYWPPWIPKRPVRLFASAQYVHNAIELCRIDTR